MKEFLLEVGQLFSNVCFPKLRHAVAAQRELFASCKESALVTNYCSAWGEREVVPEEWYGDGTFLMFEGLKVRVPSEYHEVLTQIYGDYMTPPPPEQQIGHHYAEVIDLDKSYTDYIKVNN